MSKLDELRKKYPEYNDLSDEELLNGFHRKYYSDIPIKEFYSKMGYSVEPKQPQEKSWGKVLLEGIPGTFRQTKDMVAGLASLGREALLPLTDISGSVKKANQGEEVYPLITGLAKSAGKSAKDYLMDAIKFRTPEETMVGLAPKAGETPYIDKLAQNLSKTYMTEGGLKEKASEGYLGPLMTLFGYGAGRKSLAFLDEISNPLKLIRRKASEFEGAGKKFRQVMKETTEPGLKPSIKGNRSLAQREAYTGRAGDAVVSILEDRPNLSIRNIDGSIHEGIPTTGYHLEQAVDQRAQRIFDEYDSIQKAAGQAGIKIDLNTIADDLEKFATDKVIVTNAPQVSEYASKLATRYREAGFYTPAEAQRSIALLNQELKTFYNNPVVDEASKTVVRETAVGKLRGSLDNAVDNFAGNKRYADLKKEYGALRTIRDDATKRARADLRKSNKFPVYDHTDVISSMAFIHGLIGLNPEMVAAGTAGKLIKAKMQQLRNPNTYIKKMFKAGEEYVQKSNEYKSAFNNYMASVSPKDIGPLENILPMETPGLVSEYINDVRLTPKTLPYRTQTTQPTELLRRNPLTGQPAPLPFTGGATQGYTPRLPSVGKVTPEQSARAKRLLQPTQSEQEIEDMLDSIIRRRR